MTRKMPMTLCGKNVVLITLLPASLASPESNRQAPAPILK